MVRSKFMSFLIKLCNLFTKAASNGPQRPSNSVVHETQQLAECDESIGDCNRDTSVSKDSLAWLGKSPSPKKLLYQSDINEITAIVKMLNEEKEIIAKLIEERDTAAKDDALRSHETVLNTVIKQLCTILVSNSKLLVCFGYSLNGDFIYKLLCVLLCRKNRQRLSWLTLVHRYGNRCPLN